MRKKAEKVRTAVVVKGAATKAVEAQIASNRPGITPKKK